MNKRQSSTNCTQNSHHRVNKIQPDPQFLPCKHETPEQMGKNVRRRFISSDYRKRSQRSARFRFSGLTSFDSGIATSSSLSKYRDQSRGAYFSEELLQ